MNETISLLDFKAKLKSLDGRKVIKTPTSTYHHIEVNDYCIQYVRKKDLYKDKKKEIIFLEELYKIYPEFERLTKKEVNIQFEVGNHWAPAKCLLKEVGLL